MKRLGLLFFAPLVTLAQAKKSVDPNDFPQLADLQITGAKTYFVATTGNDGYSCLDSNFPCATSIAAIGKLGPTVPIIKAPLTINIAAGTYSTGVGEIAAIFPSQPVPGAWIWLKGTCINATLTTGSATGTSTASTAGTYPAYATVTDAGATWTAGDLAGKYACLGTYTAGTNTCSLGDWPIVDNNATSFTIAEGGMSSYQTTIAVAPRIASGLGGAVAYRIRVPGSIFTGRISNVSLSSLPVDLSGQGGFASIVGDYQLGITTTGGAMDWMNVFVNCIEFRPGVVTKNVRLAQGSGAALWANTYSLVDNGVGVSIQGRNSEFIATRSVCNQASGTGGSCVGGSGNFPITYPRITSFYASGVASLFSFSSPTVKLAAVHNYIKNPTGTVYSHAGIFDGIIGADTIAGDTNGSYVLTGNNAASSTPSSSISIDAVNWSGSGGGRCAIDASNSSILFDSSGVASTGTQSGKQAAICVSNGSKVHMLVNTMSMVGTASGGSKLAEYTPNSGTLKTLADVTGAANGVLCNAYSANDGCVYTP